GGSHASHGERLSSAHFQTPFQGGFNVLHIIGELAAIKSIVSDPPKGKYRVMSTIKIVGDVSVTMSMFESQWKAYGWIQGLLSQQS
ncbi:unnamed protein product, partial [Brassica oleracea var. botrytis]